RHLVMVVWVVGGLFIGGRVFDVPENADGAAVDKARDAAAIGGLEQTLCPFRVYFKEIICGFVFAAKCSRQMENGIHSGEHIFRQFASEISDDGFDAEIQ